MPTYLGRISAYAFTYLGRISAYAFTYLGRISAYACTYLGRISADAFTPLICLATPRLRVTDTASESYALRLQVTDTASASRPLIRVMHPGSASPRLSKQTIL